LQSNLRLVVSIARVHESRGFFLFQEPHSRKESLGLDPCRREIRTRKGYKFSPCHLAGSVRRSPAPLLTRAARSVLPGSPLQTHLPYQGKTTKVSVKSSAVSQRKKEIAEKHGADDDRKTSFSRPNRAQLPISFGTPIAVRRRISRLGDFIEADIGRIPSNDCWPRICCGKIWRAYWQRLSPRSVNVAPAFGYRPRHGRMKTLEEIGQILFDLSPGTHRQIEAKALRKLAPPNRNGLCFKELHQVRPWSHCLVASPIP